jgi:hypothetical protein
MILVCIPELNPHPRFWPSFCDFWEENKRKHNLVRWLEQREPPHRVWYRAAEKAILSGATHVLFVEDDCWNFPLNGLDILLKAGKSHVAFSRMQRRAPQRNSSMRLINKSTRLKDDKTTVVGPSGHDEVEPVDLIGMYFTLVSTDLLQQIPNEAYKWDDRGPDEHFCQAILDAGYSPYVSWRYMLPHGNVTEKTRHLYRQIYVENHKAGMNQPHSLAGDVA